MYVRKRFILLGAVVLSVMLVGASFAGATISTSFTDVPPSHQFYDEISWMADNDIAGGYNDGTYRPGAPVSRGAMAAFMARLNSRYYVNQESVNPSSGTSWTEDATCDPGDRALLGAGRTSAIDVFMTDSRMSNANSLGNSWQVRWESDNNATIDPATIVVYVLCAPPLLASGG